MGALGDVVRTLPALRSLRAHYRDAHIGWLVEAKAAEVLEGQPDLDEVLIFPREELSESLVKIRPVRLAEQIREFAGTLRAGRFDLVLDFHSILKTGILARLSGSSMRVTYAPPQGREYGWIFASHRARLEPLKMSRYERNGALVSYLAIKQAEPVAPPVRHPAARAGKISEPAPLVLIHPGSSPGAAYKRYTSWGYAEVARSLVRREGVACWVAQGRDSEEALLARQIVAASDGCARLAPETRSLSDLIGLIDRARLYIGSDSGPLHIASSRGVPVVQILGPTDPIENQPWPGTASRSVCVPVACSPCRRGCVAATCMKVIPPELVVSAARELLAGIDSAGSADPESPLMATAGEGAADAAEESCSSPQGHLASG